MGFKIGSNIFTDLANTVGGMAAGKKKEESDQLKEQLAQNADTRAQEQLDLAKREGEANAQYRDFERNLQARREAGEQQSLPALQSRLMDLYKRTGVHVTPQLQQQIGSMNYEALNGELNRAEREMEVRASKQLVASQHLQLLRERQMGANAEFQFASRQWQQALDALGGGKFGPAVDKLAGTPDRTSPQWQQAAYSFLKGTADGQGLYNNYLRSGMMAYSAAGQLMAAGGGATMPTMDQRAITTQLPFEILSPQDQQARLQGVTGALQTGKPVNLPSLIRSGTPVPGLQPAAPVAQPAPDNGVGPNNPVSKAIWGGLGSIFTPPAVPSYNGMGGGELPVEAGLPLAGPTAPANADVFGGSSTTAMPSAPGQPVPPMMRMMGAGSAAMPAPSAAPLFSNPSPAPAAAIDLPNKPLFGPPPGPSIGATPGRTYPGSSMPPAPVSGDLFSRPAQLPTQHISAPAPMQPGPMGPTLPTMNVSAPMNNSAPSLSGASPLQLNKLRSAVSAPEAEQLARALLDQGMNYDLVTSSIPDAFRPLVGAKLPKRISPSLFNQ